MAFGYKLFCSLPVISSGPSCHFERSQRVEKSLSKEQYTLSGGMDPLLLTEDKVLLFRLLKLKNGQQGALLAVQIIKIPVIRRS